jgi:hypothetical protein
MRSDAPPELPPLSGLEGSQPAAYRLAIDSKLSRDAPDALASLRNLWTLMASDTVAITASAQICDPNHSPIAAL